MINDRVFNTLYGLAYKLRAVHRSSWQRINGRGAKHEADLSFSLFLSLTYTHIYIYTHFLSFPLYLFRLNLFFDVISLSLSLSLSAPLVRAGYCFAVPFHRSRLSILFRAYLSRTTYECERVVNSTITNSTAVPTHRFLHEPLDVSSTRLINDV